jgi:hypothetical protein
VGDANMVSKSHRQCEELMMKKSGSSARREGLYENQVQLMKEGRPSRLLMHGMGMVGKHALR